MEVEMTSLIDRIKGTLQGTRDKAHDHESSHAHGHVGEAQVAPEPTEEHPAGHEHKNGHKHC
jgi:hypothetical protein